MPCPSSKLLRGSGRVDVGYYTSRSIAEREARALLKARAEIEAGLAFIGYHCPEKCCRTKTLGAVASVETSVDTSWSVIGFIGYLESRYTGTVTFDWQATVTCSNSCSDLAREFIREFSRGVTGRLGELGNPFLWFEGWTGNLVSIFGWGEGCTAWEEWVLSWLEKSGWLFRVKWKLCSCWAPLPHQVVIVTLADGTQLVLDPWRDNNSPVWERKDYEREIAKLTCDDE